MGVGRVNPGGWPVRGTLTSAQMNLLDTNVSDESDRLDDVSDELDAAQEAVIAKYTPSGASVGASGALALTASLTYPSGDWTLSSYEVQVPSAGVYRLKVNATVSVASATDPESSVIHMMIGASTVIGWAVGDRFSGTAADTFRVSGETIIAITDPATQKLWLRNGTGDTITVTNVGSDNPNMHTFVIERIGNAA